MSAIVSAWAAVAVTRQAMIRSEGHHFSLSPEGRGPG
jgi:hypothetical protein